MPQNQPIAAGDTSRMADLIARHQRLVYTVCMRIVHSPPDAEDLTQETFLKALGALSSFDGADEKAWLCRIAINTCLDFQKKAGRAPREDFESVWPRLLAPDNTEETAARRDAMRRLKDALDSLPPKYAAVLTRFAEEGLSVREIAAAEHLPKKTVETRLYRARKLLRERWDDT